MSIKQSKEKSRLSGWVPAIGGVLALCFVLIAYVLSDDLLNWAVDRFAGFDGNEVDPAIMQVMFGAFIFIILSALGALIVSIALPRGKKSTVHEKTIAKERKAIAKEQAARKRRQRELARKASQSRRSDD